MRAVYHHGGYPDLEVDWGDPENEDLTGYSFTLDVFAFGKPTSFTKATGFTIPPLVGGEVPSPNLVVAWSQNPGEELDLLAEGTYVLFFSGTKTASPDLNLFGELVIRFNAPSFGYCETDDLLLGDMLLSEDLNRYTYINAAASEIDSRIGYIYELPLNLEALTVAAGSILKNINAKLASGRLILAIAVGGEQQGLHAYGNSLVQEAYAELQLVLSGSLPLDGATRIDGAEGPGAPETINQDSKSGMDAFYDNFFGFHWPPTYPPFPLTKGVWLPND